MNAELVRFCNEIPAAAGWSLVAVLGIICAVVIGVMARTLYNE